MGFADRPRKWPNWPRENLAMLTARKIQATVQEGGRIEVVSPEFSVGTTVDVIILASSENGQKPSIPDVLAECPGGILFKTAEEVDAYIREERDSWDR
jgi:hypothetical protein